MELHLSFSLSLSFLSLSLWFRFVLSANGVTGDGHKVVSSAESCLACAAFATFVFRNDERIRRHDESGKRRF